MPEQKPAHRREIAGIHYTLRVSRRARYARLRISPHEGLIVVVPHGFDERKVPGLVESRREWIEKVQVAFDRKRMSGVSDTGPELPGLLELNGIGETWRVSYEPSERNGIGVRERTGGEIVLSGTVHDASACRTAIEAWLKRRAIREMVPQLERLASIHGFGVSAVSLRKQRSRWGSCSSRGTISLNLKLLFLPPLLVRYIMIHELCHTRYMNHSRRFWAEVARYDPDYAIHDREMRHAWRYVPGWFAVHR
jgi:predicted metal-dependent hydrolase